MLRRLLFPLALIALATAVPAAYGHGAAGTLTGEVYPDAQFKIDMETASGAKLKTVKAGTYKIKVEDKASIHNFHLTGPGVDKKTSVGGKVETSWTVKLKPGRYTYVCDPHAAQMRGTFRVTK
jgi:plastocyanin